MRFKLVGGDRVVRVISRDLAVVIDYSDCIGLRGHCRYPEPDSVTTYWTEIPALVEAVREAAKQTRSLEDAWRKAGKPREASPAMVALHDQQRAASEVELARAAAEPDPPEG